MKIVSLFFTFIIFISILTSRSEALEKLPDYVDKSYGREYIVLLDNGDVISGYVVEFTSDKDEGEGILLESELGKALIFLYQIKDIYPADNYYRHNHRHYLLPTAEPIGKNHFIGNFELLFFYAGFGYSDWLSVTAGRSIVPGVPANHQVSLMNIKFTPLMMDIDESYKLSVAVGGNLAFVNHDNKFLHIYGVSTLKMTRTRITAAMFYKGWSKNFYDFKLAENYIDVPYEDGAVGLGLGLDTKLSRTKNIHVIGELWNNNIGKPSNTGVLLGLRLCNEKLSADFGLAFFTSPLAVPFVSFVWTPF